MDIKRGDIFLADLNPIIGTEQSGIRPVLIIQIDKANKASPHTIIIPFTSKIRKAVLPCHAKFKKGTGGLKEDSILLCEQIRVIDKQRLIRKLGSIDENHITKAINTLKIILGI